MKLRDSWEDNKESLMEFLDIYQISLASQSIDDFLFSYEGCLEKNWMSILSGLSPTALAVCLQSLSEGFTEIPLASKEGEPHLLKEGALELQKKGLGTLHMNAKFLKISCKFYLYEELETFLKREDRLLPFENFQKSFTRVDFTLGMVEPEGVPLELFQFYFSYGFYAPSGLLEQSFEGSLVEEWKKQGLISHAFLVLRGQNIVETKGFLCSHFKAPYKLTNRTLEFKNPENLQTQIFNDIARIVFHIQKEGCKITKKGELHRKAFERLRKIVPEESLLWLILQFLRTNHYLENLEEESYKIAESFFPFFRQSIHGTYNGLLKTNIYIGRLFKIFKEKEHLLSLGDILYRYFHAFPEELLPYMENRELRRTLVQNIELLYRIGLIERLFTREGVAIYRASDLYTQSKNYHPVPKPIFTISRSFQIIVDTTQTVSPQILYILSIFADIESYLPTYAFQVTQQTFHRALYFGFTAKEFMDILVLYSKIPPDEFLVQTIAQWSKNYKTGFFLEDGIVLQADASIIDELEHKPEYSFYIKKRLAPEYALVSKALLEQKILPESFLFFFSASRKEDTTS